MGSLLQRRIEALEAGQAAGAQGPRLLILLAPDAQPVALALPDGRRVDRLPGETQAELLARVEAMLPHGAAPVLASAVYELG